MFQGLFFTSSLWTNFRPVKTYFRYALPIQFRYKKRIKRALRDYEPDFQWMPTHRVDFKTLRPNILINHFHKADFVTKTGLTERLKSTRWHSDRNPDEFFPKCYILGMLKMFGHNFFSNFDSGSSSRNFRPISRSF